MRGRMARWGGSTAATNTRTDLAPCVQIDWVARIPGSKGGIHMTRGFDAITSVTIDASRADVWDALTNPAKVKQYMHGTEMSSDWKEGSPIHWRGEWNGKAYEDKGKILEVKPQRLLRYTHWSSMGGSED
ncbi:MAG: hypothetical protein E6I72_09515, partial [Chloroflexi bacterium]